MNEENIEKFKSYNLSKYLEDLELFGIHKTWDDICDYIISFGENNDFLNSNNFGQMYEIGLAIKDKQGKKDNGQYFTPNDVALIMSQWLEKCNGSNVCDVACGTGKLINTYLGLIGFEKARNLIKNGNLYLYDLDSCALKICKTSILVKYGVDLKDCIHDIYCDFLNEDIKLPRDCKVISNPPYASISSFDCCWCKSEVLLDTHEFYSAFMEKIFSQSISTVIITPFSYISGSKFYSLREMMSKTGNGFAISFDNVPGNIFCGRKHGIFNTNTSNSVRACITVFRKSKNEYGYRFTPLIRFKQIERNTLLNIHTLESFLPKEVQIVNCNNKMFAKVDKNLDVIYKKWISLSNGNKLSSLLDSKGQYTISMPNTCRYFTVASNNVMKRNGQIILKFSNKDYFNYIYCMINSSFVYWYWRIYDGGITYPKSLLESLPVFFNKLTNEDKEFFEQIANEMIINEGVYKVYKNNVGSQENLKFPRKYRDEINKKILEIFCIKKNENIFDIIHSNMALTINV